MKKNILLIVCAFIGLSFAGCGTDSDKDQKIKDRITALQTAINSQDVTGFLACFDPDASMSATYGGLTQFNTQFKDTSTNQYITYAFDEPVIVGDTATCTATHSNASGTTFTNVFKMVKIDDDWFINTWDENGQPMFFIPRRPQ